jgi:hypothetical protein
MLIPKNNYIRSEKHRRFITSLPCLIYGTDDVQCAHIRKGNICGAGLKPSDQYCVPLSVLAHLEQHDMPEVDFWRPYLGIKRASRLARGLYAVSGDYNKAMQLIMEWRTERIEL